MVPAKDQEMEREGVGCSVRGLACQGLSLLNSHAMASRPSPHHCGVKFLSPGNHKLLLLRKMPGGGGVDSPQLPLSGGGRWGLSSPQLPLSVCDLDQVTSCLQALQSALEED